MASTDLQQLKIVLAVRDREFARAMDRNTKRIDRFSKKSSKGLSKTTRSFNKVAFAAKALLPALSAAVLIAHTKRIVSELDNIGKTADKLGLTTDALQELRAAAEGAGVSTTTLDMAMQRFGRRVAEARQGTGEAKGALMEMGIELFDATGKAKDIEEVLNDVSDAMSTMSEQTDMNRLAMKLFDSEGVAMVNMLRDGSAALDSTREEMRKMGIVIEEDLIRKAEAAQTQLDALSRVIDANLATSLINLAPLLVKGAELMATLTGAAANFVSVISTLPASLTLLDAADDVEDTKNRIATLNDELANMSEMQRNLRGERVNQTLATFNDLLVEQEATLKAVLDARNAVNEAGAEPPAELLDGFNAELAAFGKLNVAQLERLRLSSMTAEAIAREAVAVEASALAERLRGSLIAQGIPITDSLNDSINGMVETHLRLGNAIVDNNFAQTEANKTRGASIELIDEETEALNALHEANAQQIKDFIDIIAQAKNLQDALNGVLKMALKLAATSFLQGLFGIPMTAGAGSLGNAFYSAGGGIGRASGGSVQAGGSYMVGEQGPEPFVPAQNGRILSVAQAKSAIGGGGGGQIAVRIFVDDAGKLAAIARQEGASAALPIAVQVVEEFSSSALPGRMADIQRRA